jgi:hypothetical protein
VRVRYELLNFIQLAPCAREGVELSSEIQVSVTLAVRETGRTDPRV